MLAVIQAPILGCDPSLRLETLIEGRGGKGCSDGVSGQVHLRFHHQVYGLIERLLRLTVETEYEASHNSNAARMEASHDLAVVAAHVEGLLQLFECLLIGRFKTEQQAPAAASRRPIE